MNALLTEARILQILNLQLYNDNNFIDPYTWAAGECTHMYMYISIIWFYVLYPMLHLI